MGAQAAIPSSAGWTLTKLQELAQVAVHACPASSRAFCRMLRMVRAQRPHFGLHPRQAWTWAGVRGQSGPRCRQARTARSDRTLQEQTIMRDRNSCVARVSGEATG